MSHPKKYLFIVSNFKVQGGTTFLVRVSAELRRRGHDVYVVSIGKSSDKKLLEIIERIVNKVIFVNDVMPLGMLGMPSIFILNPHVLMREIPKIDSIHAFGVFTLFLAYRISCIYGVSLSVGIYHQREFYYRLSRRFYFSEKIIEFFSRLPAESVFFLNEKNREDYASHFAGKFLTSLVMPVGINCKAFDESRGRGGRGRNTLVSIGNLVGFKVYNKHVIEAVSILRDAGVYIKYLIYGDGPELVRLEKQIEELGVSDRVFLKGRVDYDQFSNVVKDATIFVGSGTAVVEAANLGVPAVVGIEASKEPITYGFLSEIKGLSYNEKFIDAEVKTYLSVIRYVLGLTGKDYDLLCKKNYKKSLEFCVEKTVDIFEIGGSHIESSVDVSLLVRLRMLLSVIYASILDKFGWDQCFRLRRNQGD